MKEGFTRFVNVTRYPGTNKLKVEGYCIDLFDAVVAELPYAMNYEYIPFVNSDDKSAGTYNDLIYQVFLGVNRFFLKFLFISLVTVLNI